MARGRMINTTIALDPEFNAMSLEAQILFLRTIPHLDRDGLIIGQPAALWATVAPLQPALMATMQDAIDEWVLAGLVEVLPTKIGAVVYFSSFHTNQVGMRYDREPASRLPLPEGYERTADGLRKVADNPPEDIRQESDNPPREDQSEVEREDQSESEKEDRSAPEPEPEEEKTIGDDFTDDALALVKDAYHTIGKFPANSATEKGKTDLATACLLIETHGWDKCQHAIDVVAQRHTLLVHEGGPGISSPVQYLRSVLDNDKPKPPYRPHIPPVKEKNYVPPEYASIIIH
jgi:hypothetical protein